MQCAAPSVKAELNSDYFWVQAANCCHDCSTVVEARQRRCACAFALYLGTGSMRPAPAAKQRYPAPSAASVPVGMMVQHIKQ